MLVRQLTLLWLKQRCVIVMTMISAGLMRVSNLVINWWLFCTLKNDGCCISLILAITVVEFIILWTNLRCIIFRGNSKYHYYGIRIKANSPLNQFTDNETMAIRQQPMYHGKG